MKSVNLHLQEVQMELEKNVKISFPKFNCHPGKLKHIFLSLDSFLSAKKSKARPGLNGVTGGRLSKSRVVMVPLASSKRY
jgi:hypothetical protein